MPGPIFGVSVLVAAILSWRYSKTIAEFLGKSPRLRPLSKEQLDGAALDIRITSLLLYIIFIGWVFGCVKSFFSP